MRDEEAVLWLRRAVAAAPENPPAHAGLASILALTGRDAEARTMLARYLALNNTHTRTIAQWNHMPDDNAAFRQFDARFKSGLRRAGMPER
ncbi:tetratricopeptide repeat protein [Sphaerotilus sp.]|uniref:tetratricopeptide repeat protein n=1 Tax=Sphaerotilus sp. TaxID=2093942 RepID=UPI00286E9863|nr:tetratricopeptide repeat protein [Sphaerotilus sp.]